MVKRTTTEDADAASTAAPVMVKYIGPRDAESPRYGQLEPGRCYPESDAVFATYLATQHPEHWELA